MRGSSNNRKLSRIILLGVHCVKVMVTHGVMYTHQQSGTSSAHQLENTTHASPHLLVVLMAMGRSILLHVSRPTGGICRWRRLMHCGSAKTLACCQTFSFPLSTFRDRLGTMTAAVKEPSHAGGDPKPFEITLTTHSTTCAVLAIRVHWV